MVFVAIEPAHIHSQFGHLLHIFESVFSLLSEFLGQGLYWLSLCRYWLRSCFPFVEATFTAHSNLIIQKIKTFPI